MSLLLALTGGTGPPTVNCTVTSSQGQGSTATAALALTSTEALALTSTEASSQGQGSTATAALALTSTEASSQGQSTTGTFSSSVSIDCTVVSAQGQSTTALCNAAASVDKSGAARLDTIEQQVKEQAFHKKLVADYWLQVEQEKLTIPVSTPVKHAKPVVKPKPQPATEVQQVQTPAPVKPRSLINEVAATQKILDKILVANIAQEIGDAVTQVQISAELRAEMNDEELQMIMALLLEI
jgi:hypothetical protein